MQSVECTYPWRDHHAEVRGQVESRGPVDGNYIRAVGLRFRGERSGGVVGGGVGGGGGWEWEMKLTATLCFACLVNQIET